MVQITVEVLSILHRTHQRTITSHVVLITRKEQTGFPKAEYTRNGSQQVRFSGSTVNVRPLPLPSRYALMASCNVAGSGKSVLWLVYSWLLLLEVTHVSRQFNGHPRYRDHLQSWKCVNGVFLFRLPGCQQTRVARSSLFHPLPIFCSLGSSLRSSVKSLYGSRQGQEPAK